MDYSAANLSLWGFVIQLGLIGGVILLAMLLRQKVPFVRKTMMPIAVLAGFMLLAVKYIFKAFSVEIIDGAVMEILVYHGIALGFIAMSLRVPQRKESGGGAVGLRSGAVIVSSYMIQGVVGLLITLLLSYTFMPGLYRFNCYNAARYGS